MVIREYRLSKPAQTKSILFRACKWQPNRGRYSREHAYTRKIQPRRTYHPAIASLHLMVLRKIQPLFVLHALVGAIVRLVVEMPVLFDV